MAMAYRFPGGWLKSENSASATGAMQAYCQSYSARSTPSANGKLTMPNKVDNVTKPAT
jgi:hypothetical protein